MTSEKIKYPYIFAGFATLISVSFLDNVRGPLLPVITKELNIGYGETAYFLTIGSFAAIAATFFMGKMLEKFSEKAVTLWICIFCVLPGILAPFVNGLVSLLLLGLVMGSCVALMGSICNILTINGSPKNIRGQLLSIQQMMYGVGSFLGPLVFSFFIKYGFPWWSAIVAVSTTNLLLTFTLWQKLPLDLVLPKPVKMKEPFNFNLTLPVVLFAVFVGGEVLTSMWMSTFFIQVAGISNAYASELNSYFFIIIGFSRLLSSVFVKGQWERFVIIAALLTGISFILAAVFINPLLLPGAGFVGPFFPLLMAQISKVFPEEWKKMTIWIFAAIQFALGIIHLTVGRITDFFGMKTAFLLSPILMGIATILTLVFFHRHPTESH